LILARPKLTVLLSTATFILAVQNLVDVGDIADVEVRCGDLVVKAHKAVLTSHSLTFHTAFNNHNLGT
jgi:hypothetical protein